MEHAIKLKPGCRADQDRLEWLQATADIAEWMNLEVNFHRTGMTITYPMVTRRRNRKAKNAAKKAALQQQGA